MSIKSLLQSYDCSKHGSMGSLGKLGRLLQREFERVERMERLVDGKRARHCIVVELLAGRLERDCIGEQHEIELELDLEHNIH